MSALRFGPEAGLPAGFALCPVGTVLLRGHSPDRRPAWFGPVVGERGRNRFDLPYRERESDPGVCYLASTLDGVLLERVIRDARRDVSVGTLQTWHAITHFVTTRDILLIDRLVGPWIRHGVQVGEVAAPPPYHATQELAACLALLAPDGAAVSPPALPDGILYGSRFSATVECVALWNRAAGALERKQTMSLGDDRVALAAACLRLGIGLVP